MEKYGFVYIWFDRKHKRYYIGCRWGRVDDGYICSSPWMKNAYKRRPQDFKRRVLASGIMCRQGLLDEEHRWLAHIKDEELGVRYYNLNNKKFGHWTAKHPDTVKTIGEKISAAHKKDPNRGWWSKGRTVSEETREKLRASNKKQMTEEQRLIRSNKTSALWADPAYREMQLAKKRGRKRDPEAIRKSQETKLRNGYKAGFKKGSVPWNKGIEATSIKGLWWYTNGVVNTKSRECPEGFWSGRTNAVDKVLNTTKHYDCYTE